MTKTTTDRKERHAVRTIDARRISACRGAGVRTRRRARAGAKLSVETLTLIIPLAAGTGMDTLARLYAEPLGHALGKPVVIENKPGAGTDDRRGRGRIGSARRPHHRRLDRDADVGQPGALQEDAVRPDQGFHADLFLREIAVRPGGRSEAAGQLGARADQVRQGERDADELQHGGRRQFAASVDGVHGAALRPEADARALPRLDRRRSPTSRPVTSTWASPRPAPRCR